MRDKLAHVSNFIQNAPFDGQPATEKTEVWMAHTKSTLYFVFICHDRHPDLIRGHLARRENILNDDGVAVLLDSFRDRRLGVMFKVNPAGVQADGAWSEPSNTDYSYDTVWDPRPRNQRRLDGADCNSLPQRSLSQQRIGLGRGPGPFFRATLKRIYGRVWPQTSRASLVRKALCTESKA